MADSGNSEEIPKKRKGWEAGIPHRRRSVTLSGERIDRALVIITEAVNDLRKSATGYEITCNANRGRELAELIRTYMTTYDVYKLRKQYEELERKVQAMVLRQQQQHSVPGSQLQ